MSILVCYTFVNSESNINEKPWYDFDKGPPIKEVGNDVYFLDIDFYLK